MSADVDVSDIGVSGSLDVGLSDVNVEVGGGLELGGGLDVGLNDIRANVTAGGNVGLDLGLDNVRLRELAPVRVNASIDQIPEIRTTSQVDLGLDNVRTTSEVDLGLDDIRIRELPRIQFELSFRPIRIHLPLNYSFTLQVLGVPLFKFSACGQGMAIAEDYEPRETEKCR